jgi:hypothetical protein
LGTQTCIPNGMQILNKHKPNRIVGQVGHLQELYLVAQSTEHTRT